jgi:hypothetical protein
VECRYLQSESPSGLLQWLKEVYPDRNSLPDGIVYDNACTVVKHIDEGGAGAAQYQYLMDSEWVVDRFHYHGHSDHDEVCKK